MRSLFATVPFFLSIPLVAQVTLYQTDMPSAGDTLRSWTATLPGFDGAQTGPAHTWDFSQLTPLTEVADTAVTVGSTPFLYQFFFNNGLLYPDHDADYAVKGQDFDFQLLQVTDLYDYYKKAGTAFSNVGFGANINGLPSSVRRLPVDHVYRFPLSYGDQDSSFSTWEIAVPTLFFFRQEQWRYNTVDGWGTLQLPTDTFEVIRVRSVLQRTDSIHIDQFGTGFTVPEPETVEYKWLAVAEGHPVLQVNTLGGVPNLVRFRHDPQATAIAGPVREQEGRPYPNPAVDMVHVRMPSGAAGDLLLLDAGGREVRRVPGVRAHAVVAMDLQGLSAGTYQLRLSDPAIRWNGRLVVDR